ncbi:MAG: GntR family transcriptional regulator [Candidatus Cryptobacteroides sp.]
MEFDSNKPIYLQISDTICEKILDGSLMADGRIPSVREYGAQLGVNPNTIMRTYEILTSDGIVYNKRGLGYFISPDAKDKVKELKRKEFLEDIVPKISRQMQLLGFGPEVFEYGDNPSEG